MDAFAREVAWATPLTQQLPRPEVARIQPHGGLRRVGVSLARLPVSRDLGAKVFVAMRSLLTEKPQLVEAKPVGNTKRASRHVKQRCLYAELLAKQTRRRSEELCNVA